MTQAVPARRSSGLFILITILTLVWGTNWTLMPLAVREVSVWTFRGISVPGAGIALLLLARVRGESLRVPRREWPVLAAAAFFYLVLWYVATTYAAVFIPSGQAAILGFTMPVWTALIAVLFLRQRMDARTVFAVVMAGAAVALLAGRGWRAYADAPAGFVLGIGAALGWAIGTLILKLRPPSVPMLVSAGWQLMLAAVPIGAVALWRAGQPQLPSPTTIVIIGYITLVPMALGNAIWFSIVRALPAQVAGLSAVMTPVVAMASGHLILGEPLGLVEFAAMVLASASVLVALWPRR